MTYELTCWTVVEYPQVEARGAAVVSRRAVVPDDQYLSRTLEAADCP